jgi:transketolase
MLGVATGLSCRNKIPFCSGFSAFLMRAADQIRIAGIGGNTIKIVGSHSGCSIGEDGPSQMGLEDISFFRNIPKGIVIAPSDGVSTEKAVEIVGNYNEGPAYIRTSRPEVPVIYENN